MLWKHSSWEYVVFFCSCICTLARACYISLAFLTSVFTWKSKLSLTSRFTPSNLTLSSLKISVLEICISTGVLELVKRLDFPAFATSYLLKTNETFFIMLLVDCLAHFLYLKSMCKESCHLHIQRSQYLLVFQKTCQIYILNKSGPKTEPWGTPENNTSHELTAESTFVLCLLSWGKNKWNLLFFKSICIEFSY